MPPSVLPRRSSLSRRAPAFTTLLLVLAAALASCLGSSSRYDFELLQQGHADKNISAVAHWWVNADRLRDSDALADAFVTAKLEKLTELGLLDTARNKSLVDQCSDPEAKEQCPVGLIMPEQCCSEGPACEYDGVDFPNPRISDLWPRSTHTCNVQQVCSKCQFKYEEGRGAQFRIVQANDPNFLPYSCSKPCSDGCAVILTRHALVAQAMRFISYWWEWMLLGISVASIFMVAMLLPYCHRGVLDERGKVIALLLVGLIMFAAGMIMLCAAGLPGTSAETIVTRTLGGGWQNTVFITGVVHTSAATFLLLVTALDVALSLMLSKTSAAVRAAGRMTRSRSGVIRSLLLVKTLRFETLATVMVGSLVTIVLVLITPALFDSNRSECLVYTNVPEIRQWYQGNFDLWADDQTATDQMVSVWIATAYTVNMFAVVWSFNVAFGLLTKLIISYAPTRCQIRPPSSKNRKPYANFVTESLETSRDPSVADKMVSRSASSRSPNVTPTDAVGDVEDGAMLQQQQQPINNSTAIKRNGASTELHGNLP